MKQIKKILLLCVFALCANTGNLSLYGMKNNENHFHPDFYEGFELDEEFAEALNDNDYDCDEACKPDIDIETTRSLVSKFRVQAIKETLIFGWTYKFKKNPPIIERELTNFFQLVKEEEQQLVKRWNKNFYLADFYEFSDTKFGKEIKEKIMRYCTKRNLAKPYKISIQSMLATCALLHKFKKEAIYLFGEQFYILKKYVLQTINDFSKLNSYIKSLHKLDKAMDNGDIKTVDKLIQKDPRLVYVYFSPTTPIKDINSKDVEPLIFKAIRLKNLYIIKYLIDINTHFVYYSNNHLKKSEHSLISYAAGEGTPEIVEYLISKGADPNSIENDGRHPIHYAAEKGNTKVVKYFIEKQGVNPQITDKNGKQPIHHAFVMGHTDTIKYLTARQGPHLAYYTQDKIIL